MTQQPADESPPAIDLAALLARVVVLENEVAKIKHTLGDKSNWLDQIKGSFKDDPGFDEIIRLGREIRQADFS